MKEFFEEYFAEENPVCREERQYALFLYSRLLQMVGQKNPKDDVILKACGLPMDGELCIRSVAYEATYMRDFFWKDRELREERKAQEKKKLDYEETLEKDNQEDCFNRKLYEYVRIQLEREGVDCEEVISRIPRNRNLGGKIEWGDVDERMVKYFREMMNTKPDIAVYYEYKGKEYLKFLECKYLSKVKKYEGVSQLEIQSRICKFLCSWMEITSVEAGLVQFKEKNEKKEDNVLELRQLIPTNLGGKK